MKRAWIAMLMLAMVTAGGCSTYQLRGKVIEGPASGVMVVDASDPRLEMPGIHGAMLDITLDPNQMSEKMLGKFQSDLDGNFAIPISELGAGMFEYDVEIVARHHGFQAAIQKLRLPPSNRRLLVVLSEGRDTYRSRRDIIEESLRIGGEQNQ